MSLSVTTNAGNLAKRLRARSQKYVREVKEAQVQNADLLLQKAKQFSQQRFFSLGQLKAMGHPYAKRDPRPPVRPHIINRQGGQFYQSWKRQVRQFGDGVTATVYNTAPHSRYMLGTKLMIERPVLDEAERRTQAARARNLRNARRRGYYRVAGR